MNILLIVGDNQKLTRITFKSIKSSIFGVGSFALHAWMNNFLFPYVVHIVERERNFNVLLKEGFDILIIMMLHKIDSEIISSRRQP